MVDFTLYIILSLIIPIFVLLGVIIIKVLAGRVLPESNYTPVDQLLGQTPIEFHEEKVVQIQEDDRGDDKDKNIAKSYRE